MVLEKLWGGGKAAPPKAPLPKTSAPTAGAPVQVVPGMYGVPPDPLYDPLYPPTGFPSWGWEAMPGYPPPSWVCRTCGAHAAPNSAECPGCGEDRPGFERQEGPVKCTTCGGLGHAGAVCPSNPDLTCGFCGSGRPDHSPNCRVHLWRTGQLRTFDYCGMKNLSLIHI